MALFISRPNANPLCLPPDEMKEFDSLAKCLKLQWAITRDQNDGSFIFYYPKNGELVLKRLVIKDYEALIRQLKFIIEEERTITDV